MPFVENRVYVRDFSSLPKDSPLLTPVPTAPGHKQQFIHKAVLADFMDMSSALNKDLGFPILVASGWRPPLWATRTAYEKDMIAQYGSVAKGQKFRAFASSHQTALAFDFGCGGLYPVSKTIDEQKKTKTYLWLVDNAYKYGWTNFHVEPWHYEHKVTQQAFLTGIPEVLTLGPVYVNRTCEDDNCVEELDELSKV